MFELAHNTALISINGTLVVQMLSFLVFLFIINRLMFQPLQEVMKQREQSLKGAEGDIDTARDEVDRMARELAENEAAMRAEVADFVRDMEEQGAAEAARVLDQARDEMDKTKQAAAREIDAQLETARQDLSRESEIIAIQIMEKLLDRRMD